MSSLFDPQPTVASDRRVRLGVLVLLAAILAAELGAIGVIFKHRIPFYCIDNWPVLACRMASLSLVGLYCVLGALALIAMLRPAPFRALFAEARLRAVPLGLNLAGVALAFVPLPFLVEGRAAGMVLPSFACWTLGMALILAGICLCAASPGAWRRFGGEIGGSLALAVAAGLGAPWLAILVRPLWGGLDGIADVTFGAVAWIVGALGYDVQVDPEAKFIGAGDFFIDVAPQCSGIEGFALVTLFVTLYLWLFRADLRFPRALLLYPAGLVASAAFNVLRVAALLIIGLEGNPELAVGGFHSHAGWLMFTLVAFGIIAVAQTVPGLKRRPARIAATPARTAAAAGPLPFWRDPVVARILPFSVFMLTALLTSTLTVAPGEVYPLRALTVAAIMLPFWGLYRALGWRIDPAAVAVGAAIAALWVLVPVAPAEAPPYGNLAGGALVLWMIARGLGTTILVPVLEELFFRDYLESRLRRGAGAAWAIGAALVTATLFAALHDRWAEAFAAGLLFSWLAARPGGRITDAILAHGVANGLVYAAALATGRFEII